MQKNWYVVYTKPHLEKKVAALLTKKKIESFCPMGCIETQNFRKSKLVFKPLFASYVFVNISQADIKTILNTDGVVNMLYWLGQPAIINDNEVEAIRDFIADHRNIVIEKNNVNVNSQVHSNNASFYAIDGNMLTVKNKTIKVNLPSLGFTMVAQVEETSIFGRESIGQNTTFAHS